MRETCHVAAHMDESFGTTLIESRRDPTDASLNDIIPAGEPWMGVVCRGQTFRIVDIEGNQAVDTLFFNAVEQRRALQRRGHDPLARAALPPTGSQLLSNDGNVMLTITADTCGRHDTLGGACSAEQYGAVLARQAAHAQLPR